MATISFRGYDNFFIFILRVPSQWVILLHLYFIEWKVFQYEQAEASDYSNFDATVWIQCQYWKTKWQFTFNVLLSIESNASNVLGKCSNNPHRNSKDSFYISFRGHFPYYIHLKGLRETINFGCKMIDNILVLKP